MRQVFVLFVPPRLVGCSAWRLDSARQRSTSAARLGGSVARWLLGWGSARRGGSVRLCGAARSRSARRCGAAWSLYSPWRLGEVRHCGGAASRLVFRGGSARLGDAAAPAARNLSSSSARAPEAINTARVFTARAPSLAAIVAQTKAKGKLKRARA